MGRKSTRENKTVYQIARERRNLTVEAAGNEMAGMTDVRLSKIESGATRIQPEDVIAMAECYKAPELCNYYCTHECAIGKDRIDEVSIKPFGQIGIETINAINRMSRYKDRLLEIIEDGQVRNDEMIDFIAIKAILDKISVSINELELWVDTQILNGKIDKSVFGK